MQPLATCRQILKVSRSYSIRNSSMRSKQRPDSNFISGIRKRTKQNINIMVKYENRNRDTSGLGVQVHKNMSVTQKAKKLEFRTLETIITRYDEYGKTKSTITSKCINADAEVINALGVSKAVLEHVIFCHQEDSNWPLCKFCYI